MAWLNVSVLSYLLFEIHALKQGKMQLAICFFLHLDVTSAKEKVTHRVGIAYFKAFFN